MIAYKVVIEAGGGYFSVIASNKLKVKYKVGQKVEGVEGTPLFVFRTLKRAADFKKCNEYKNAAIWECQIGRYPGKRPKRILSVVDATVEDVKKFWENPDVRYDFWVTTPGTVLAKWVKLIRRIEE